MPVSGFVNSCTQEAVRCSCLYVVLHVDVAYVAYSKEIFCIIHCTLRTVSAFAIAFITLSFLLLMLLCSF